MIRREAKGVAGLYGMGDSSAGFVQASRAGLMQQKQAAAKVRVIIKAPTNMSENVSMPISVSVVPADAKARSIRDSLKEYGITAISLRLDGPGFSLSPAEPQESQWLAEDLVEWTWVAGPKAPGPQTLLITLTARGKPDWSSEPIVGPIWTGTVQITVDQNSGLDFSKLDLFAPLNTLAGLGLTCPWIFEQIRKRRGKKASAK